MLSLPMVLHIQEQLLKLFKLYFSVIRISLQRWPPEPQISHVHVILDIMIKHDNMMLLVESWNIFHHRCLVDIATNCYDEISKITNTAPAVCRHVHARDMPGTSPRRWRRKWWAAVWDESSASIIHTQKVGKPWWLVIYDISWCCSQRFASSW